MYKDEELELLSKFLCVCVEIVKLLFVFLCMLKFNLKFTGLFFKIV